MISPRQLCQLLAVLSVGLTCLLSSALAQEPRWQTGTDFDHALKSTVTITWQQVPLREGLRRLSAKTGAGLFLDRRLDPGQLVDLRQSDVTLQTALQALALREQAELTRIGSLLYLGPRDPDSKLTQVAALRRQEITALPAALRSRLLTTRPWNWEELAQPRQLVEQLAKEAGLQVSNLDALPHDLWPAVSLPPLSWCDRLTVVLAGFRLTFTVDKATNTLTLKPM